jgi:hypothetical protein
MFQRGLDQSVISDEGFAVKHLSLNWLKYTENSKELHIFYEFLVGPTVIGISASSISTWDPPNNQEAINELKKKQILENVRRAFEFEGVKIQIS